MKKETVYKITIGVLLALNLLQLIGFLFAPKPQRMRVQKGHFENEAVQILNLNNEQQKKFINFAEGHRDKMKILYDQQTELASEYFHQPNDSLLDLITKIETEKISTTQQHFSDVKSILNQNQISDFEKFKKKALQSILKKNTDLPPPQERRR